MLLLGNEFVSFAEHPARETSLRDVRKEFDYENQFPPRPDDALPAVGNPSTSGEVSGWRLK